MMQYRADAAVQQPFNGAILDMLLCGMRQDGEALIRYGERGDKLYLIRYGKVRILRPDESAPGGRVEVAKLGRGNLVGERTVVTGECATQLHLSSTVSALS